LLCLEYNNILTQSDCHTRYAKERALVIGGSLNSQIRLISNILKMLSALIYDPNESFTFSFTGSVHNF